MQETWVLSLGLEGPLEKGMAYPLQYSGLENSMERVGHNWATFHLISTLLNSTFVSDLDLDALDILTYFLFTPTAWGNYLYLCVTDELSETQKYSKLPKVTQIGK